MNPSAEKIAHLCNLEPYLRSVIRGQDHLLPRMAAAFCRGALSLTSPDRPRASLLLVGPTGTGKTESFTQACNYVCGPNRMLSFDMSEYQDKSAVNKLLGEGRDDPGLLGRALDTLSEGALLFDEVEKAHPLVMDLFLQILWQGRITVATGQTFLLGKFFIGFTSNIGSAEAIRMETSKFSTVENAVLRSLERTLRPELLGRIEEKLVFSPLHPAVQREIADLEVARETARLRGLGFDLSVSKQALQFMMGQGINRESGARPLRRTVDSLLQNAVTQALFQVGYARGNVVPHADGKKLTLLGDP